jgi:hypothetical protein
MKKVRVAILDIVLANVFGLATTAGLPSKGYSCKFLTDAQI